MKNAVITLGIILLATSVEGQILRASYNNAGIIAEVDKSVGTLAELQSYPFRSHVDGTITLRTTVCSDAGTVYSCLMAFDGLKLGNNIIEVSYVKAGKEFKSNPVIVFYTIREDIPKKCKVGSYDFKRITNTSELKAALNGVEYVAFSYATSNAIYVISCQLE